MWFGEATYGFAIIYLSFQIKLWIVPLQYAELIYCLEGLAGDNLYDVTEGWNIQVIKNLILSAGHGGITLSKRSIINKLFFLFSKSEDRFICHEQNETLQRTNCW